MEKHRGSERGHWMAAFAVLFLIEGTIAVQVHNRFVQPCMGDVLVVVLVYCFVRIFQPEGIRRLPAYVLLFAVCVEILQYFRLVKVLGLEGHGAVRTILGSVFDWKDIACYGAGCLILQWMEHIGPKYRDTKQGDPDDIRLGDRS